MTYLYDTMHGVEPSLGKFRPVAFKDRINLYPGAVIFDRFDTAKRVVLSVLLCRRERLERQILEIRGMTEETCPIIKDPYS